MPSRLGRGRHAGLVSVTPPPFAGLSRASHHTCAVTATSLPHSADVVVVGAGAIGACVARELALCGREVVVLEHGAVGGAASAGTAGLITAGHAERIANRAALAEGLRAMWDRSSPIAVHARPSMYCWLARFVAASLNGHSAETGTSVLTRLAMESLEAHRQLHAAVDTGLVQHGLLNLYSLGTDDSVRASDAADLGRRGVVCEEIDADALEHFEPGLQGVAGALFLRDEAHLDSRHFTERVAGAAEREGARFLTGVDVNRVRRTKNAIRVETSAGAVDGALLVIAAGVGSAALAADMGIDLPVIAGKGYHLEYPGGKAELTRPAFLGSSRVVATPLGGRIRLAGTVELGANPNRVDARRTTAIANAGRKYVRGIDVEHPMGVWTGLRPLAPDGMPVVGHVDNDHRVILATGHGMLGITLAPRTGTLIRSLAQGEELPSYLSVIHPSRFRGWRRFVPVR